MVLQKRPSYVTNSTNLSSRQRREVNEITRIRAGSQLPDRRTTNSTNSHTLTHPLCHEARSGRTSCLSSAPTTILHIKMKTTTPQKPKQKIVARSQSSSPKQRCYSAHTIYLDEPRFVFLPFFSTRVRTIIDCTHTWYQYQDVMGLLDIEDASRSVHRLQRLVRRVIAKWDPFPSKMRKYTVISESDFYRLMYAAKIIDGGSPYDLDEAPSTNKLAQPGGDLDAHELELYRTQLSDRHADWRQDKTGSPRMDDWNQRA